MRRLLVAPLTVFFQLQTNLDFLFILLGVKIHPLALGAFELDKIVLTHKR